jgi:hypothetical protein
MRRDKMMNNRGQLSIINIIFFVILAFIMAVLTPVLSTFLEDSITSGNITGTSATLMHLIVPFMWIALLITLFLYVAPVRPQQF